MVGDGANLTVVDFTVFCPKVLAGINTTRWPDTVVDRSIIIQLRRKKREEPIGKLRYRILHAETEALRASLERWAAEHVEALRDAYPELPDTLDDRAAEGWEPLFAITELADQEHDASWTARAHQAAAKLASATDDDSQAITVLAAMRRVFGDDNVVTTEIATDALNRNDELPFGGYRNGQGLDGRGLARLLKPFDIQPRVVRIGEATPRGYRRDDFTDAWERYCNTLAPGSGASDAQHAQQVSNGGGFRAIADAQQSPDVADQESVENPRQHWDVADVADENGKPGGDEFERDEQLAVIRAVFPDAEQVP